MLVGVQQFWKGKRFSLWPSVMVNNGLSMLSPRSGSGCCIRFHTKFGLFPMGPYFNSAGWLIWESILLLEYLELFIINIYHLVKSYEINFTYKNVVELKLLS